MVCQADQISELPFDLKQHGIIPYDRSLRIDSFSEGLQRQLGHLNDRLDDSPVSAFLDVGLSMCVNRALAARRNALRKLKLVVGNPDAAMGAIDRLNQEWKSRDMEIT